MEEEALEEADEEEDDDDQGEEEMKKQAAAQREEEWSARLGGAMEKMRQVRLWVGGWVWLLTLVVHVGALAGLN